MLFSFRNIDSAFTKGRREHIGDIQPKFWFFNDRKSVLVKRQSSMKVNGQKAKSKMYNHFGEYFGYLIAQKAGLDVCPVYLVSLHDTKNQYGVSKRLYTACASEKVLQLDEDMAFGELIIEKFKNRYPETYRNIIDTSYIPIGTQRGNIAVNDENDNIDIVIASIKTETENYERKAGKRTEAEIQEDVQANIANMIEKVVYDCIFGNSDRHSGNWGMRYKSADGTVKVYPLYDNERVLGLSIPIAEVEKSIIDGNLTEFHEKNLFSRMGFSKMHTGVIYTDMLSHIVQKYPEYAIPAIQKITTQVDLAYIENLYNGVSKISERGEDADELTEEDELPEAYKILGTQLLKDRQAYVLQLLKKYEKNKMEKMDTEKSFF